uniref:Uncharacterized protein n=1 Tax=Knipowitschia caucasica TaxID=637954 RepID=A0AAV2J9M7_KNICA
MSPVGAALRQLLMQELIREHHRLFSKVPPPSLRLMASSGAPCLRQRSLPLITERDDPGQSFVSKSEFHQKKVLGHRHTSSHPDTCLFLAPRSCSPAPRHLEEPLPKADALSWTEAWTDLRDPDLDLDPGLDCWTPEAPNEGLASLSSSASTYDNLSGSFQNLPGPNGGEQKADESWSSCDIIPWEETESPSPNAKRRSSLATTETTRDTEVLVQQQFESAPCTTPTSRSDPSLSPLSTGSSEVFLPSGPPELQEQEGRTGTEQPSDLHSLLGELQRQMAQQREEYQARIQRLERCNAVLERQVALLRLTLEQQKRNHSVAETHIKHMQRQKEDAEQRNHRLQRDLDSFNHTDSDVTNPQTDAEKKKKKKKKKKKGPPQTRPLQSL